LGQLVVQQLE
jgi:hypothetical protein